MPVGTKGYLRGNEVFWDGERWRYADGQPAHGNPRACPFCGLLPATPDGPDPCLGVLSGISGACCGHRVHYGYINIEPVPAPPGWFAGAYVGV